MDKLTRKNIIRALIVIIGVALLMHPSLILCSLGTLIWVGMVYMLANFVSLVCFHKSIHKLFLEDDED